MNVRRALRDLRVRGKGATASEKERNNERKKREGIREEKKRGEEEKKESLLRFRQVLCPLIYATHPRELFYADVAPAGFYGPLWIT